jgi:hypothetical protein
VHRRRVKSGGNKKVMFTEGWVEFGDKGVARATADALNATPIGGNKRGFYSSDLWTLKYLRHFKWHHLTEKVAYEKRIAAQKLRAELAAAKKDAEGYVARVEQARGIADMEARKLKGKGMGKGKGASGEDADDAAAGAGGRSAKRQKVSGGGDGGGEDGAAAAAAAAVEAERAKIRRTFKQRQPLPDRTLGLDGGLRAAAGGDAGGGAAGASGSTGAGHERGVGKKAAARGAGQ